MALTKQKKAEKVTALAAELEGSTSAIVGTFAKLTVAQDFALRNVVRGAGGKYRVLKNKLAERASKGSQVEAALQGLRGVSSVAYTSGDPVALTKAISTWVTDNAEFTFKLGIVDGKLISIEEIKQLATMPGKKELYAKLLFLINAPAQRLATVMAATGRDLAVVVNQAVEQNKFAGGAVPATPESAASTEAAATQDAANPDTANQDAANPDKANPDTATPDAAASTEATGAQQGHATHAAIPAVEAGAAPDVTGAAQADPAQPETGEASQAASAATEAPAEG